MLGGPAKHPDGIPQGVLGEARIMQIFQAAQVRLIGLEVLGRPRDQSGPLGVEQGNSAGPGDLLGDLGLQGEGVSQDLPDAVVWYRRAAAQGEVAAQLALARLYETGLQGHPDLAEAYYWYHRVSESGHAMSESAGADKARLGRQMSADELGLAKKFIKFRKQW